LHNARAVRGDAIFFEPKRPARQRRNFPDPRIAKMLRINQVLVCINDLHESKKSGLAGQPDNYY
jgi:hypothetical protein